MIILLVCKPWWDTKGNKFEGRGVGEVYYSARTALTKYHGLGGLNRNVSSHSSGSWKSGIKVSAGLVLSESCEEKKNLFQAPLLVCRWPSSHSHDVLPICVPVSKRSPYIRTVILD